MAKNNVETFPVPARVLDAGEMLAGDPVGATTSTTTGRLAEIIQFKSTWEPCPTCVDVCLTCPDLGPCQRVNPCAKLRAHHRTPGSFFPRAAKGA